MDARRPTNTAILGMAVLVLSACVRVSEGTPVADPAASTPTRSTTAGPTTGGGQPEPGVVPTDRAPVPANTATCTPPTKPPVSALAQIADPKAPRITVGVPEGWGISAGSRDVGVALSGPDGAAATVSIAATQLDPEAAFRDYTDGLMNRAAISTVSILPAELCSYSGQKLMGTLSDRPGEGVDFTDHIVHVWTNAGDYLIAVHVQSPTTAVVDDAAVALVTDEFEIRIP